MVSTSSQTPNPHRILATLQAYRDAAALKTAIELELFTRIAHGADTAGKIAGELCIPVRGVRLLCEYLAATGLLVQEDEEFKLTADVAMYLDRRSPAFLGDVVQVLYSPAMMRSYERLTEAVRAGQAGELGEGKTTARPAWFDLARGLTEPAAATRALLDALKLPEGQPIKILDIGGGDGVYGIALAARYPDSVIVALDNPAALQQAQENAVAAKLGSRYQNIPGDPLEASLGQEYDAAIMARGLYQFDESQTTSVMMRIHYALKKTGRLYILEFVSEDNPDFIRDFAGMRLNMLAATPHGEAHSLDYVKGLLESSGFRDVEGRRIPAACATLVTARP